MDGYSGRLGANGRNRAVGLGYFGICSENDRFTQGFRQEEIHDCESCFAKGVVDYARDAGGVRVHVDILHCDGQRVPSSGTGRRCRVQERAWEHHLGGIVSEICDCPCERWISARCLQLFGHQGNLCGTFGSTADDPAVFRVAASYGARDVCSEGAEHCERWRACGNARWYEFAELGAPRVWCERSCEQKAEPIRQAGRHAEHISCACAPTHDRTHIAAPKRSEHFVLSGGAALAQIAAAESERHGHQLPAALCPVCASCEGGP